MTPAPEPGRLGTALRPEPASRAPCARLGREITPAGLLRERPQIRAVGPGLAFLDHDESRIDAVRGHGAHPSAVSVGRNAPHLHDSSLQHGAKPPLRLAAARLCRLGRIHARNPELHTAEAAANDYRVTVTDVLDPCLEDERKAPAPREMTDKPEQKKNDEAAHHEDGGCGRARHGRPPKNLSVCFPDARMVVFRYTFCVFLAK